MTISLDELQTILVDRWAYQPAQVGRVVEKLQKMDEDLYLAFAKYLETGTFPDSPAYFGLSPLEINNHYPFKPPAVFLCLDWIKRDPQNALDALVEEYKMPLPIGFNPGLLQKYLKSQQDNSQKGEIQ